MLIFKQVPVGSMDNFAYIIGNSITKEAAVIDAAWEMDKILNILSENGLQAKYILNTHCHYDHTDGNKAMKEKTKAAIGIHKSEKFYLDSFTDTPADFTFKDGDLLHLGEIEIKFIHTPGHSPGSCCILVENKLITGDTLFIGSIGRTDFPGGDKEQMFLSLQDKIKTLPDNTEIYPGHNYGTTPSSTVKQEKKFNRFLIANSLEQFVKIVSGNSGE